MPVSASPGGSRPSATSAMAPAIAHMASGRRNGLMITPAVAGMMMLQTSSVSWAGRVTANIEWTNSFCRDGRMRRRCLRALRTLVAGLREQQPAEHEADGSDDSERQEGGAVARMDHDYARQGRRERRADGLSRDHGALRDVEAPCVAHQIGDDHRHDRAEDAGADAVEQLHRHQPTLGI